MRINLMAVWPTHAALPHLEGEQRADRRGGQSGRAGGRAGPHHPLRHQVADRFFEALRTELQPQGVDVTIVYPGVVATEIWRNGWNAAGERAGSSGLSEDKAMSVEECAGLIVAAMRSRKRDEVMSPGKLGRWLKLIAPARVDRDARAALNKQH